MPDIPYYTISGNCEILHLTLEQSKCRQMNAMFSVVAIVALVATTVAGIRIRKFSEKALEDLQLINLDHAIAVKFMNSRHEVQLKIIYDQVENAVTFRLDPKNAANNKFKPGIKLNKEEVMFFDILSLRIKVDIQEESEASLAIFLLLDPSDKDMFILEIPIFTTPFGLGAEDTDPLYWRKWAAENRVGIFAPIVRNAWDAALESGEIVFDLRRLEELLSYNIYPSKQSHCIGGEEIKTFATRPLVSERTKQVLMKIVNKFMSKAQMSRE